MNGQSDDAMIAMNLRRDPKSKFYYYTSLNPNPDKP